MPAFYVSDLDGTLLNAAEGLSEFSRGRLQRLLADGITFSVASARSVHSMQPLLRNLDLTLPIVEFNGAFVSDLSTGRHEIVNALNPAVAEAIFGLLYASTRSLFVSTFNGSADCLYYSGISNEGESYYVANRRENNDPRLRQTSDIAATLSEQVVCLTVIGRLEVLEDLELAVRDGFGRDVEIHLFENFYSPGWYWLTVHDASATKDQAIDEISRRYSLGDHDLVVFGDHLNDVRMFQRATHAVAVSNAHPEAKRHATEIIGTNEDDAVVRFIEEHYRGPAEAQ